MVAAWIKAETGVGPSMASGSQTWSGNWADLPTAPANMRMTAVVRYGSLITPRFRRFEGLPHVEGARRPPEHEDADKQAHVPDSGGDEGLLGRLGRRPLL